jgi:hypothetical protein
MTPKEKALELVDKYDFLQAVVEGFNFYDSKQCALIAVNEMTKYNPNIYHNDMVKEKYWQEVKQEIEKL